MEVEWKIWAANRVFFGNSGWKFNPVIGIGISTDHQQFRHGGTEILRFLFIFPSSNLLDALSFFLSEHCLPSLLL